MELLPRRSDHRAFRLGDRLALSATLPRLRRADFRPRREYFCPALLGEDRAGSAPVVQYLRAAFSRCQRRRSYLRQCLQRAAAFFSARSWACYPRQELADHPLRQAVQKFKYGRRVSLGKPLGRLMACGCQEFLDAWQADLILPVPLHSKRTRWRGFNQSVLLARQVSRVYDIPMDPMFAAAQSKRPRRKPSSTKRKRRKNMRGVLALDARSFGRR